jgi:hypothetical protein
MGNSNGRISSKKEDLTAPLKQYSLIAFAINFARFTGTAFPIICSRFVLVPENLKSLGKVCK